jgi:hypothetical protein
MTIDGPAPLEEWVTVPAVVGLEVRDAEEACLAASLLAVSDDSDGASLHSRTWPGYFTVTAQDPAPGLLAKRSDTVVISFVKEGGSDDANDRVPVEPPPGTLRARATPSKPSAPPAEAPLGAITLD